MKKITSSLLAFLLIIVTLLTPVSSLAASKTASGTGNQSFTINTGKNGATLTLTPSKGKLAKDYVLKDNKNKKHTVTGSFYGSYTVTVDGKSYTVFSKKVAVKLGGNKTYYVTVKYNGINNLDVTLFYSGSLFHPAWQWKQNGSSYWKKAPSIKLSVNNWASIY